MIKSEFAEQIQNFQSAYRAVYKYQLLLSNAVSQVEQNLLRRVRKTKVLPIYPNTERLPQYAYTSDYFPLSLLSHTQAWSEYLNSLRMYMNWVEFRYHIGSHSYFSFLHLGDASVPQYFAAQNEADLSSVVIPHGEAFVFFLLGKRFKAREDVNYIVKKGKLLDKQVFDAAQDTHALIQRFDLADFYSSKSINNVLHEFRYFVKQHNSVYLSLLK